MTAEGYQSDPLSEELERRIRAKLISYQVNRVPGASVAIHALEWVLHEAEAMKAIACELAECKSEKPPKNFCPRCFHVHEGFLECGVDLGGGGKCDCKAEVTA